MFQIISQDTLIVIVFWIRLGVAMHRPGRERRQANSDVLGAAPEWCGIAHPFAALGDDGLPGRHIQFAGLTVHALCTRTVPRKTTVYSSKSGVCPGSSQPSGLRMWAILTLTPSAGVLTRPKYSSMIFGLLPPDSMRAGCRIRVGMTVLHRNNQRGSVQAGSCAGYGLYSHSARNKPSVRYIAL